MTIDLNIPIDELIRVLSAIRRDGGRILSQPLGFYRILVTARDGTSPGLMLHAWLDSHQPRQSRTSSRDLHSHTFDMQSRVLSGELRNELFAVIDDPQGDHRIAYIRQEGAKATRVVIDRRVRVVLEHEETVAQGATYEFVAKRFHCTTVRKYPTITLMNKQRMIAGNALNVLPLDYSEADLGTYMQPELDQDALWRRIIGVLRGVSR